MIMKLILIFLFLLSCSKAINEDDARNKITAYYKSFDLQDGSGSFDIEKMEICEIKVYQDKYQVKAFIVGQYSNYSIENYVSSSFQDTLYFLVSHDEKEAKSFNPVEF